MIPYNYRRLMKEGFEDGFCEQLWGKDWPVLRTTALKTLLITNPVDVSPILHILSTENPNADQDKSLYPPWENFYFEKPFTLDESSMREFFELRHPDRINEEIAKHKDQMRLDGLLVSACKTERLVSRGIKTGQTLFARAKDGYIYLVMCLTYPKNGKAFFSYLFNFAVDATGTLCWDPKTRQIPIETLLPDKKTFGLPVLMFNRQIGQDVQADVQAVCRFVHFMQSRNIKAKLKHFPDYKPRKHQRHKVYKYYELTVVKPSINEISQPHGEGVKGKALHSVRGHIAHYTQDMPLFGIAGLHGDFFIPQHVRGDIKCGKVEKTYRTEEHSQSRPEGPF